jgi:hypothetical protein
MSEPIRSEEALLLAALANGIIPPDERDAGATAVDAGPRLADRLAAGTNAALYRTGLSVASSLARERFHREIPLLDAAQLHELMGLLRQQQPGFFKQLRLDVCALYLSDPGVWQRIGFPGPSTAQGGYPDFDQPQP